MDQTPQKKLIEDAKGFYQEFERIVAVREGDGILMISAKMALRVFGILAMIVLSPFLIIGLTLAFIAVF